MELILKQDVQNLGFKDDVVTVKNGYGRNFLIPQGAAILATPSAKKVLAETMVDGAEMCIKYSKPGDSILHLGPQLMQNYESVREKIIKGLEEGCKKYE